MDTRTISSDEYKLLARNSKIKHNVTGDIVTITTRRMWGLETAECGFIDKYNLVVDYSIEDLTHSYCVINHALERKFQIANKKAAK